MFEDFSQEEFEMQPGDIHVLTPASSPVKPVNVTPVQSGPASPVEKSPRLTMEQMMSESPVKDPVLPVMNYKRTKLPQLTLTEMTDFERAPNQDCDFALVIRSETGELVLSEITVIARSKYVKAKMFVNTHRDCRTNAEWWMRSRNKKNYVQIEKTFIYARIEDQDVIQNADNPDIVQLQNRAHTLYFGYYFQFGLVLSGQLNLQALAISGKSNKIFTLLIHSTVSLL